MKKNVFLCLFCMVIGLFVSACDIGYAREEEKESIINIQTKKEE